jgi:hypothetical protein
MRLIFLVVCVLLLAACTKSLEPAAESASMLPPEQMSSTTSSNLQSSSLPLLTEQTDSFVYLTTDNTLTVVDLDSAVVTVHEIPELAPGDPPYRIVSRGERLVFYGQTQTDPAVYVLDPSESLTPQLIDEAWYFVPSAEEDRVWLALNPDNAGPLESVREVTTDGTVVVADVPISQTGWLLGALTAGLLIQGDSSLEVWDPNTQALVDHLPDPFPVATWHNRIATCAGSCSQLELFDLDTDAHFVVDAPTGGMSFDGYGGEFSPDGRYIAVPTFSNEAPSSDTSVAVTLIDFEIGAADSAETVPGSEQDQQGYPMVAWSPDSEWIFFFNWSAGTGGQLLAYRPGDESAYAVGVYLEGAYYGMATGS